MKKNKKELPLIVREMGGALLLLALLLIAQRIVFYTAVFIIQISK